MTPTQLAIVALPLLAAAQTPPPLQNPWEGVPDAYRKLAAGTFQVPSSRQEWARRRPAVKKIVLASLGELPRRPSPPRAKVVSIEQRDGYRIEKFTLSNGVDSEIPGYLALPAKPGKLPAIVSLHGHGSSKENIFGTQPSSQTVSEMLARKGYVVLAIDAYFNGERRGKGPAGELEMQARNDQEMSLFKLNLWLGRTLWGMMVRDEQVALDYLVTRPEVDPTRIGVQGMSMGSTRAWWLAAVDDRIRAVVGVACFTRYEDLIAIRALRAHGIYYFVPGILKHFDSEGVMSLIAPRPFLALTGDRDAGSPPEGMKTLERILAPVWTIHGAADRFQSVIYPETGHVYNDDMKQRMVAWFEKHL